MKVIRSTKCSLKFSNKGKLEQLYTFTEEYTRLVNVFINQFWLMTPAKGQLLASIVNAPKSWLTHRAKKEGARQAVDLINSVKKLKGNKPIFSGKAIHLTSNNVELHLSKKSKFDAWLHIASIGNKAIFDLPIKLHKHFHKLAKQGKLLNSFEVSKTAVTFCFEIETGPKKEDGINIGVDSGIKALGSLSNGKQYGEKTEEYIARINRCKQNSNGQKRAKRAFKQYINETVKQIFNDNDIKLIVVEQLKNLSHKMKLKRRLSKNMRRVIGSWTYRHWLTKLQSESEVRRSYFRPVPSYYTSQICPACNHADKKNRLSQEIFKCQNCGHTDNADINAAKNILNRFVLGPYGAEFKS